MTKLDDIPAQEQSRQPGRQEPLDPQPITIREGYRGNDRLKDKVALITGGDSGIGRAIAVHFAAEGAAAIYIVYLDEHDDADATRKLVEERGAKCILIAGDVAEPGFAGDVIDRIVDEQGGLDVLVNNAAEQWPQEDPRDLTMEQARQTFETNFFGYFSFIEAALEVLEEGATIINTTSVTAYRGSGHLIDYASTKGAIVALTRSLAQQLASRNIRVNGVAPGPIWTPLIPASFDADKVEDFGADTPLGRAGHPSEVAPCYVFLASDDASYMTGQVLHPNGGDYMSS